MINKIKNKIIKILKMKNKIKRMMIMIRKTKEKIFLKLKINRKFNKIQEKNNSKNKNADLPYL